MHDPDRRYAARLAAYGNVSGRLALLSDRRLGAAVASAVPLGSGIGGRSARLDVDGTPVFVKRVPLTDLELRPEHVRSTANLFELPLYYQYGVGSAGFSAWRELAAHALTTGWVLGNAYQGFPLMHHWRVLPDTPPEPEAYAGEFGGIDGAVAHWEGSPAVRERLTALGRASSSLVLFLEYVPQTLTAWLDGHRAGDAAPYHWAEKELMRGTAFLASQGFVHFDAHFDNILTDGRLLYFADFGLALHSGFELTYTEAEFLTRHLPYDRCHTAGHLLHHLLRRVFPDAEPDAVLREWLTGRRPDGLPPEAAALLARHAAPAAALRGFRRRLLTESKRTPFPVDEIEGALAVATPAGP
ncbi:protein kinase family protein [Streptomyces sp. NPDC048483]|uniref:protein kinase family protein n=1 Tax=Streptomyces sp. NPDC048483 TaxID=3154927 RepID=UPI003448092A